MTDRGPYSGDSDPTEAFPPLPDAPPPMPPSDLPPIGSERDPDPTRVLPPTQGDVPTTAMASTGGPYDPGPPFGPPPVGGGGEEPPFEPEPVPWYRQPGPLAALIAGLAALVVAVIALIVWTGDDDDGAISGETLPSVASTSSTTSTSPTSTTAPATTSTTATTTTVPPTTTSTSTTTTTTSTTTTTTTVPTTTTTLPPTTTAAPTTTAPPAPTTTSPPLPVVTIPAGQSIWDGIADNDDLSILQAGLECTGLDEGVKSGAVGTVLSPPDTAFEDAGLGDPCANLNLSEPILLLHLVSVDMTAEDIFASPTLQTEGATLPVDSQAQTIGSNGAKIVVRNVRGTGGFLQVVDRLVQG